MNDVDVFNGDADGILSLVQLRLNEPRQSQLVSGVKRDIQLLAPLTEQPIDRLTVLDISVDKNIEALKRLLERGVQVFYADHHRADLLPTHQGLDANINTHSATCTALIINQLLNRQYEAWAIAAAYGDNLVAVANELCLANGYSRAQSGFLQELGELVNYNGYGERLSDLHINPVALYKQLLEFKSPFELMPTSSSVITQLRQAKQRDWQQLSQIQAHTSVESLEAYLLPNEAWARRTSGVFANELSIRNPTKAIVVAIKKPAGLLISLRAPQNQPCGASALCSAYPSGGGRERAAGINQLPEPQFEHFLSAVKHFYTR